MYQVIILEKHHIVIPLDQILGTSYFYGGYIENVGFNTIDSLRVHAEISSENFTS